MLTHSSILAWGIPWTEEPGRLQSMGSHMTEHTAHGEKYLQGPTLRLGGQNACEGRLPDQGQSPA